MRIICALKRVFAISTLVQASGAIQEQSKTNSTSIETYRIPSQIAQLHDFSIRVRSAGTNESWQEVQSYQAMVSKVNTTSGSGEIHNVSVATFDFTGAVDLSISYHAANVEKFDIRPWSYGIDFKTQGNSLSFSLEKPTNVMIQVNSDEFQALHLLTNPIDATYDKDGPGVWFFGPGVNNGPAADKIQNGTLSVPSNTVLYIASGGILNASVSFENVANSTIQGHGLLYHTKSGGVLVENSTNVYIRDVIILNPGGYAVLAGQSNGVIVDGIRSFSAQGNGDGIDLFCCRNSAINRVFMRNSDDNVALYQHRWNYYGNSSNLTISNSALWADVAHPINIGTHGNADDPETMSGVNIFNIDIMHHKESQMWYQGTIAINPGDENTIENVHVQNVRVEEIIAGQLVNLRVDYNAKYNAAPGRAIRNVYIEGMTYLGTKANPSLVLGYDETRLISNVTFRGLVVDGKAIFDDMEKPAWYYTADFVPMFVNEHVNGLNFTQG